MKTISRRLVNVVFLVLLCAVASGCATRSVEDPVYDPLERVNRGIFAFNTKLDDYIIRPTAKGYKAITPDPVEVGVTNFFNNLDDVNVIVNDVLQGKFKQAGSDIARFLVNSTVGVLGIFDVGSRIGLEKHYETWGQTFGKWGFGEGPFIMLPLYGPSNLRATVGRVTGTYTTYPRYIDDDVTLITMQATEIVAFRAALLGSDELLNQASLDPYIFVRDFWSRRHRQQTLDNDITDQTSPSSPEQDELDELDELSELDELNELDELDELDQLDRLPPPTNNDIDSP